MFPLFRSPLYMFWRFEKFIYALWQQIWRFSLKCWWLFRQNKSHWLITCGDTVGTVVGLHLTALNLFLAKDFRPNLSGIKLALTSNSGEAGSRFVIEANIIALMSKRIVGEAKKWLFEVEVFDLEIVLFE